ncbi:MAG: TauD/TfdA family dioxygenase [Phycisphaerae bacterium]|nr:TauD/TfdA family dioxygenase [candidate division KSB1 bacterium]NIV00719.1 TauD/TfdA family dioxygenase [Phycisphaerae bacterium]NIR71196.1 TauD/TfdA family dioxygenase [candidate division KSB1 bacterium]NIT71228.1 TauD/TfdA family dioxygenase [candidate division KSB1 bacterium]NIU24932.1 TauD/TfdA family dioxygenase [candidate division KSB1 bacterium]
MKTLKSKTLGDKKMPTARRKTVAASQESWIKTGHLLPDKEIPFLVEPAMDGLNLVEWAKNNRPFIEEVLLQHRALLFRNFNVKNVDEFEAFVMATSDGDLLEYRDRTTPRHSEGGQSDRIYISTIYPSEQTIKPHNEGTYWMKWARKLYFCCLTAPEQGGETPIHDVRKVYERIDPEIRNRFIEKQWMLVRNFNDGFGLTWQEVFQTEDKSEVEEYCRNNSINFEWKDGDRLRTESIRPAVRKHPETGEPVWFNHAAFYHHSSLEPSMREALLAEFSEKNLPYNTCYGDGMLISPEDAEHIRQAYEQEKVMFPWQKGDVLLLDNMTIAHAREPYIGDRRIVVAMTEPVYASN